MASGFGQLVLVLGDGHIPYRALMIPEKFQKMLVPGKIQHVICTGNMLDIEQYEKLHMLSPNVHIVAGDCEQESAYPEEKIITIGAFKIGLLHGHQIIPWEDKESLMALQRRLDVDILITGHSHRCSVYVEEGKWFINPGSITGAFTGSNRECIPSFMLLAMQGTKIVAFIYELKGDSIVVSKSEFNKSN